MRSEYAYGSDTGSEDYERKKPSKQSKKATSGHPKHGPKQPAADGGGRARPTNNQLLYKAFFRWEHQNLQMSSPDVASLPIETSACPSVTACFLQVLQALCSAEDMRTVGAKRNILRILSTNTRRTKVVELSSGTHRVPEELKKHYLSDGEGGQYSTNLDRNRYGNDDNYLFTVIRYDLEFLGFCPCMVDVEIIDAKAGNAATVVQSGLDACTCSNRAQHIAVAKSHPEAVPNTTAAVVAAAINKQLQQVSQPGQPAASPVLLNHLRAPPNNPRKGNGRRASGSPMRSNSGVSGLFDALVMAATGEAEGAAAGGGGQEANAESAFGVRAVEGVAGDVVGGDAPDAPGGSALVVNNFIASRFPKPTGTGGQHMRPPPQRSRSRLWSALSLGELDSLQNALDAYVKADEEIVSQPYNGLSEALLPAGTPGGEPTARVRRRKPPRGNSSFLLRAADSTGGMSGLSQLGISLGFKETSGDNLVGETGPAGEDDEGEVDGEGGDASADAHGRRAHHRPVPRQFSSVGMAGHAVLQAQEVKRLTGELETLKAENRRLREALLKQPRAAGAPDPTTLFSLEQDLSEARGELNTTLQRCQALEARERVSNERARFAEERGTSLTMELAKSRAEVNILMTKLVGAGGVAAGLAGAGGVAAALQGQAAAAAPVPAAATAAAGAGGCAGALNGKAPAGFDPSVFSAQLAALQQQAAAGASGSGASERASASASQAEAKASGGGGAPPPPADDATKAEGGALAGAKRQAPEGGSDPPLMGSAAKRPTGVGVAEVTAS
ncbi:hypothetical protein FOA52_011722 [Chlamydomonas sp. UWO 241]|nr:hypothetical protein FOA52_011722 [Chlamydomonas sp. UWO 241]